MVRLVVVVVLLGVLLGAGRDLAGRGDVDVSARPGTASADAASCRRASAPVRVRLSRRRWPHVADHVADIRGRYPAVWHIDPAHDRAHREASLRGVPTRPGYDRDEQPPAMSREGGEGADVRLVPSGENRSQGAAMGARLRPYCDGAPFRLVVRR